MSISATIILSQSSVGIHQNLAAGVAVTNNNGFSINVTGIEPSIVSTSDSPAEDATSHATSQPGIPNPLILAGQTAYFGFPLVVHAPQSSPIGPKSNTFSVSCVVYSTGGSVSPSPATLTVLPIP